MLPFLPWTDESRPWSLRDFALPADFRLLMLGPHPDDFDAIAVTLRLLRDRGHALQVAVASSGSGVEDAYRPGLTLAEKAQLRDAEQRQSARLFGLPEADLTFLQLDNGPDGQLIESVANRAQLAAFIAARNPQLLFLPHGHDSNSAHRAMFTMVRDYAASATRPLALGLIRDPKTIAMPARWYLPFGPDEAAWKGALLRCHDTQHQRNLNTRGHGFDERILAHNRQLARELGLDSEYAEIFGLELHHWPESCILRK